MPRKKKGRTPKKVEVEHDKGTDSEFASDEETNPLLQDKDSIEYKIVHAKHPFEKSKFVESKTLTPSQRAITCCIQLNGGWVTEDELLAFLQKNWGFIGKMNTKLPNNMPDTRILHINLAVKKKSIPLFVQKPGDPMTWTVNTSTEGTFGITKSKSGNFNYSNSSLPKEKNSEEEEAPVPTDSGSLLYQITQETEESSSFEALVYDELKKYPEGITLEDFAKSIEFLNGKNGIFPQLEPTRRVRAVLIAKKAIGSAYEYNGKWSVNDISPKPQIQQTHFHHDAFPDCLKHANITGMSVDEFYKVLKENHVYQ